MSDCGHALDTAGVCGICARETEMQAAFSGYNYVPGTEQSRWDRIATALERIANALEKQAG